MADCEAEIQELRFKIESEFTQVYILVRALGDCLVGVQGWHHKTFPASLSVADIMNGDAILDHLMWPLSAP